MTIRSDNPAHIDDVVNWLKGSDKLKGSKIKSPNFKHMIVLQDELVMVSQHGWPRRTADAADLPFADFIHPDSPMWMGFADQQLVLQRRVHERPS